jgi:hypothetical protein
MRVNDENGDRIEGGERGLYVESERQATLSLLEGRYGSEGDDDGTGIHRCHHGTYPRSGSTWHVSTESSLSSSRTWQVEKAVPCHHRPCIQVCVPFSSDLSLQLLSWRTQQTSIIQPVFYPKPVQSLSYQPRFNIPSINTLKQNRKSVLPGI